MPKLSVFIGTYNRADLLRECLESVVNQSFRDFEIVVVDDGSTDNTREVVSKFPVIYFYQRNQGVSQVANRGVELSQGEYIAFLGSDDVLLKDSLEKRVEVLDKHPEVGFCYGQALLMDEKGHIFGKRKARTHGGLQDRKDVIKRFLLFSGNAIIPSTLMARRARIVQVGMFNPAFPSIEDTDLFSRMAKQYDVFYLDEPLAAYRVHPGNMSRVPDLELWERVHTHINEGIFQDPELGPIFLPLRSRAYSRCHFAMAEQAYSARQMKATRAELWKAFRLHPPSALSWTWPFLLAKSWFPVSLLEATHSWRRNLSVASNRRTRPAQGASPATVNEGRVMSDGEP